MELIVKIGADQQGLASTIERMKAQFKNMNTSAPDSWSAMTSARNQYGNIFKSNAEGGLAKFTEGLNSINPQLGSFASRLIEMGPAIGIATVAVGSLALGIKTAIGSINEAGMLARQSRISGASGSMLDKVSLAANVAGIDQGSAFAAINKLNAAVGAANSGEKESRKLFADLGIDPAGQSVDQLISNLKGKFAGMKDPAARERAARGLFGRGGSEMTELLGELDAGPDAFESRDIETLGAVKQSATRWWENLKDTASDAFREVLALSLRTVGLGKDPGLFGFSQTVGEAFVKPDAPAKPPAIEKDSDWWRALREFQKEGKASKSGAEDKPLSFQADAMAQAGLFSGSSLLFNPNFTVQQEQLEALRAIRANTDKLGNGDYQ